MKKFLAVLSSNNEITYTAKTARYRLGLHLLNFSSEKTRVDLRNKTIIIIMYDKFSILSLSVRYPSIHITVFYIIVLWID